MVNPLRFNWEMGMLTPIGAVAQLGERYNGIVEVVGSIPIGSTISLQSFFAIL